MGVLKKVPNKGKEKTRILISKNHLVFIVVILLVIGIYFFGSGMINRNTCGNHKCEREWNPENYYETCQTCPIDCTCPTWSESDVGQLVAWWRYTLPHNTIENYMCGPDDFYTPFIGFTYLNKPVNVKYFGAQTWVDGRLRNSQIALCSIVAHDSMPGYMTACGFDISSLDPHQSHLIQICYYLTDEVNSPIQASKICRSVELPKGCQ